MVPLAVALDVLREASKRRWFIALGFVITLGLALCALGLHLDVVGGALAATRLFGTSVPTDIQPAEAALAAVYRATTYGLFYGGLAFGIVACSDFGPQLLSPGRIEHLLALPVRRWELLFGTYAGVMLLAAIGGTYGAGGLTLVLGLKSGVWTLRPIVAGLLATVAFAGIYGAMLASSLFVRSAPVGAAVGLWLVLLGIVASSRTDLAALFDPGAGRSVFLALTLPFPRTARLAEVASDLAGGARSPLPELARLVAGFVLFGVASLMVGVWRFEQRDF